MSSGIFEIIQQIDEYILLYINGLGTVFWDNFWIFITNKYASIPLYIVLLYAFYRYKGARKIGILLLFISLMIFCTDQLSNFFKYGVQRLRPCHNSNLIEVLRIWHCGGKFGYFSAHASNSLALAVFFSRIFRENLPKLKYVLMFWVFLIGISRIYLAVHYPSDVLTGWCFGLLFGFIFVRLFEIFCKINSDKN